MNPMLSKPQPEEQLVGVVIDNPELFAAHKRLIKCQELFRQQWHGFAEDLGFTKPRFCYSGFTDFWVSRCQVSPKNPDLAFYKGDWRSQPRVCPPKGSTKAELLVIQEKWKAASIRNFGSNNPLNTCQEHTFHVMLGRPSILNWPECYSVYAEDERLVFFGKAHGITEYLEERGFEVVQVIDNIHQL